MGHILTVALLLLTHIMALHTSPANPALYHTESQIEEQIGQLIKDHSPDVEVNRRYCEKGGIKYSILEITGKGQQNGKPMEAIITCNIHARELLASEACLEFAREIVKGDKERSRFVRDGASFRIFYHGNQMRDAVIKGQYCRRTDKNDVDINRNFPTGWQGQKPGEETNPGPKPLSQPFSQCIEQQVDQRKPDIFLDIHTGQFSMYYRSTANNQKAKILETEQIVLKSIVSRVCANCRFRPDENEGTMYADMKVRKGIKWANLFQIYGGNNLKESRNEQCFTIFNPKTKRSLQYYVRRSKNMMVQYFFNIIHQERPPANPNGIPAL